jgi:hypothetical protein
VLCKRSTSFFPQPAGEILTGEHGSLLIIQNNQDMELEYNQSPESCQIHFPASGHIGQMKDYLSDEGEY